MISKSLLPVALALLGWPLITTAAPNNELERRAVCDSGIYGELTPILAGYSVAQAFCSQVYPVKCTSNVAKRAAPTTTTKKSTTTTKPTTTPQKTTTTTKPVTTKPATTPKATTTTATKSSTTKVDPKSSAWSKCKQQPGNVISTLCSCIGKPAACPTTSSSTTTTTTTKPTTPATTSSSTSTSSSTTTESTTTTSSSTTSSSTTSSSSTTTTTTAMTTPSTTEASTTTSSSTTSAAPQPTPNPQRCNSLQDGPVDCGGACACIEAVDGNGYCADSYVLVDDYYVYCSTNKDCSPNGVCYGGVCASGDSCPATFGVPAMHARALFG